MFVKHNQKTEHNKGSQLLLIYKLDIFSFFIQGVLSLTFAEDAAKPSKDKDAMYSARPEIEVLLLLLNL